MTLPVGEEYAIEIATVGADHFRWLRKKNYAGWVVLVDENTRKHCLPRLQPWLDHPQLAIIEVAAGERHKHLGTCQYLWEEMFRAGVGRRWCVLNLGGGVMGDMGGFVASTFKRGIDFVQIPTTLLSQVDASVGGKLGIDFFNVKNSIGVFRNPEAVWIDPAFLTTLSDREVRSGYAEIVKHALIHDAAHWESLVALEDLSTTDWAPIIAHSVDVKRQIVEEDPHERGRRKLLNFGHTIGHAIESYWLETEQRLLHGEAIAAGMIMETWLSHRLASLSEAELAAVTQYLLKVYGHQPVPTSAHDQLIGLMKQDKKNEDSRINFTLLERIGHGIPNATAEPELILESVAFYNGLA
ncbi:3-dehydroquinate synthase [Lewinella sp. W8]|uniref:3-dehydroquinate synthase n=1 Tax=Lewinella sp. W8 TaxID=2528208 RepID=UPI001068D18B|nr:3-dehydroquinate synthase [Lewinella sp. W8]MTB50869.1 3-dehydroquinate synthase [Lewinella sp. W8]